jgi:hypothetical protein
MIQCRILYVTMMLLLVFGCTSAQEITSQPNEPAKVFMVTNPIRQSRPDETISLDFGSMKDAVPGLTKENAAIYDIQGKQFLVTQLLDIEGKVELLFQDDFAPGQTKSYRLMKLPTGIRKPCPQATTYACFLPERHDDFAWENDKVANRMYGPALEFETITNGIDAWGKCVPYPVVEKFIRVYVQKEVPYHHDHGEGGDFYKVGNTLGCGAMAPFIDDKVCLTPHNFVKWDILANGPIRSVFELTYQPWKAGPYTVSEKIRISIDLGSNMTRLECHYKSDDTRTLPLAAGIILRDTSDQTWSADNIIAYWLPADYDAGYMGNGVVFSDAYNTTKQQADSHLLLTLDRDISKPVVYYAGSCWDRNAQFSTYEKWQKYLTDFKDRIDHPVIIKMND